MISRRTKNALAAKKAQGVKLGGLNAKGIANREEALERAEQLRPIFAELAGLSYRKMAAELNTRKIPTPAGGQWHAVRAWVDKPRIIAAHALPMALLDAHRCRLYLSGPKERHHYQ